MKTICSGVEAVRAEVKKAIKNGNAAGMLQAAHRHSAKMYMSGVHKYELYKDNVAQGEFREELGLIMKDFNEGLRRKFIDEVRSGSPNPASLHWKVVERDVKTSEDQEEVKKQHDKEKQESKSLLRRNRDERVRRLLNKHGL